MTEVTRILSAMESGDPLAAEQLLPLVYDELRRLAAQKMAQEKPGHPLQATALVHEAYIRLVTPAKTSLQEEVETAHWSSKGHFFAAAAEAMRRILVEAARHESRIKRGGDRKRVQLDEACCIVESPSDDVLALDEALERLAKLAPEKAEVVKLRYFTGLTIPEAAEALGISVATAERHWSFARTWLYSELKGAEPVRE